MISHLSPSPWVVGIPSHHPEGRRSERRGLDEAQLPGARDGAQPGRHLQLAEDVMQVPLHGLHTQDEPRRHLLVRSPGSFYTLRFLLGVAEAGFGPGTIFYLTQCYPVAERAKALSCFMAAIPLSGVLGGPLSGALLTLNGAAGLKDWQWVFLAEGLPSV